MSWKMSPSRCGVRTTPKRDGKEAAKGGEAFGCGGDMSLRENGCGDRVEGLRWTAKRRPPRTESDNVRRPRFGDGDIPQCQNGDRLQPSRWPGREGTRQRDGWPGTGQVHGGGSWVSGLFGVVSVGGKRPGRGNYRRGGVARAAVFSLRVLPAPASAPARSTPPALTLAGVGSAVRVRQGHGEAVRPRTKMELRQGEGKGKLQGLWGARRGRDKVVKKRDKGGRPCLGGSR